VCLPVPGPITESNECTGWKWTWPATCELYFLSREIWTGNVLAPRRFIEMDGGAVAAGATPQSDFPRAGQGLPTTFLDIHAVNTTLLHPFHTCVAFRRCGGGWADSMGTALMTALVPIMACCTSAAYGLLGRHVIGCPHASCCQTGKRLAAIPLSPSTVHHWRIVEIIGAHLQREGLCGLVTLLKPNAWTLNAVRLACILMSRQTVCCDEIGSLLCRTDTFYWKIFWVRDIGGIILSFKYMNEK
jgi:hypothetical protein